MADRAQPLVAIEIVDWNAWRDTFECLASLRTLAYPNYRVIVVDNASSDDSEAKIRAAFPDVTMIQSGANRGFAGGAFSERNGVTNHVGVNQRDEATCRSRERQPMPRARACWRDVTRGCYRRECAPFLHWTDGPALRSRDARARGHRTRNATMVRALKALRG